VEASVNEVLATFDCKVDGCDGTAYKSSGRYAYLCSFHIAEAREKAQLALQNGDVEHDEIAPVTNGAIHKRSHQFRAAGLVQLGKQLDEAMAACEQAPIRLEEAQRRWDAAIAQLTAEICPPNVIY
jgi:hypothetical protein